VDEGKASVAHVPLPSTKYATGCAKTLRMEGTDRTQTSTTLWKTSRVGGTGREVQGICRG